MSKKDKTIAAYRNALVNVWKLGGRVRGIEERGQHPSYYLTDCQYVAEKILKRHDKALHKELEKIPYARIDVTKKGRVKIRK